MLNFPTSRMEVCHVTVPIPNLSAQHAGLRIVQLSDFHFGDRRDQPNALHPQVLPDIVQQIHSLKPDLICYTGDFINGNPKTIESLCEVLGQISGRLGNYAVLGNHDSCSPQSAEHVAHHLKRANIHVLNNEVCYPCGVELALVGFECLWQYARPPRFDPAAIMAQIPGHIPKIILAHSPQFADFLAPWPVELQLSGHTHGGQLALPGLGPLIPQFWRLYGHLPSPIQSWYFQQIPRRIRMTQKAHLLQGLYSINQGFLYVNRGLGAHFPGRLFCRPEMTVITLAPANDYAALSLTVPEIST